MAAQDLQSQHWRQSQSSLRDSARDSAGKRDDQWLTVVIKSLLTKRWWAVALVVLASGSIAYFASETISSTSAVANTSLLHVGLPSLPGSDSYHELSPSTCAALLTSPELLNRVRDRHRISQSSLLLAEKIEVRSPRSTGLINVSLNWGSPDEAIRILNGLSEVFIESIASMRRERLREHIKHIELAELEAASDVDAVRQEIGRLERERSELLASEGQSSELYKNVLSNVADTRIAIDEKRLQELGIKQQTDVIARKIQDLQTARQSEVVALQQDAIASISSVLEQVKNHYTSKSKRGEQIAAFIEEIKRTSPQANEAGAVQQASFEEAYDLTAWHRDLAMILANNAHLVSSDYRGQLQSTIQTIFASGASRIELISSEIRSLEKRQESFELELIPIKNQLDLLVKREAEYANQAKEIGASLGGGSTTQLSEAEQRLEKAQGRLASYDMQLEGLTQLEQCRIREWSVSNPASFETTTVDSNRKKIAVLIFGACGLVFGAPLFLLEWSHCRELPHLKMFRGLGLPVLAERVLKHFSVNRREPWVFDASASTGSEGETLRMLALRLQQTAYRKGSVFLFSGMTPANVGLPLTTALAQCLADREEKVLIVDAVSPSNSTSPPRELLMVDLENSEAVSEITGREKPSKSDNSNRHGLGLSEYLSGAVSSVNEIIQGTEFPNVDALASGTKKFPREAMARSSLTRLLNECREQYSIILINGPSLSDAADTQMLAARVDGVVILAGAGAHRDPAARASLKDLVELGAPIIGVVA